MHAPFFLPFSKEPGVKQTQRARFKNGVARAQSEKSGRNALPCQKKVVILQRF